MASGQKPINAFTSERARELNKKGQEKRWTAKHRDEQALKMYRSMHDPIFETKRLLALKKGWSKAAKRNHLKGNARRSTRERGAEVPPEWMDFYKYFRWWKHRAFNGGRFATCEVMLMIIEIEIVLLKYKKEHPS